MRSSGGFLLLRGRGAFLELGAGLGIDPPASKPGRGTVSAAQNMVSLSAFPVVLDKMNAIRAGFVRHGYHLEDILGQIVQKVNRTY